ncbi:kin of IRRE-like protein 3 [Tubulanus polymorphus]|uniref:kin of IRRE-like protein 3 n=1 Tax=Tubulanus polymorphus TaxID=672921 RepID=UPI003DA2A651
MATSTLSITATKTMNQARYRCQTGNLYKDTTITVHYPADSVSLTPLKSVVRKGGSIRFNCSATDGNPSNYTFRWQFSAISGVWKSIESTESRKDHLNLDNLSKAYSGRYRCQVTNTAGFTISNIATVDVQYAPRLSRELEPVTARLGESAEFTIIYDANPSTTTINCSSNLTSKGIWSTPVKMYWKVILESVQASDYGFHSCQLKHSIGSLEITLKLIEFVGGKWSDAITVNPLMIAGVILGSTSFVLVVMFLLALVYITRQLRNGGLVVKHESNQP